jgi:hypothetical protein
VPCIGVWEDGEAGGVSERWGMMVGLPQAAEPKRSTSAPTDAREGGQLRYLKAPLRISRPMGNNLLRVCTRLLHDPVTLALLQMLRTVGHQRGLRGGLLRRCLSPFHHDTLARQLRV